MRALNKISSHTNEIPVKIPVIGKMPVDIPVIGESLSWVSIQRARCRKHNRRIKISNYSINGA